MSLEIISYKKGDLERFPFFRPNW